MRIKLKANDASTAAAAATTATTTAAAATDQSDLESIIQDVPIHRKSTKKKLPLYQVLDKLLLILRGKDTYGFFLTPVDTEAVPDYLNVIQTPMDFSTMRQKLDSKSYLTFEQFMHDFELICRNAMTYNAPSTLYYKKAQMLHTFGMKLLAREKDSVEEMQQQQQPTDKKRKRVSKKEETSQQEMIITQSEQPLLDGLDLKTVQPKTAKRALMRRALDGGFFYTNPSAHYNADGSLHLSPAEFLELDLSPFAIQPGDTFYTLGSACPRLAVPFTTRRPQITVSYENEAALEQNMFALKDPQNDSAFDYLVRGPLLTRAYKQSLYEFCQYEENEQVPEPLNDDPVMSPLNEDHVMSHAVRLMDWITRGASRLSRQVHQLIQGIPASQPNEPPFTDDVDYKWTQRDVAAAVHVSLRARQMQRSPLQPDITMTTNTNASLPVPEALAENAQFLLALQAHQDRRYALRQSPAVYPAADQERALVEKIQDRLLAWCREQTGLVLKGEAAQWIRQCQGEKEMASVRGGLLPWLQHVKIEQGGGAVPVVLTESIKQETDDSEK